MWRCACLDVSAQTITHSVRALDDVISHPYEARRDAEQKKNNAFRAERLQASQSLYVPSFDPRSRFGSTARSTLAFYLTRLLLDLYVCVKHPAVVAFVLLITGHSGDPWKVHSANRPPRHSSGPSEDSQEAAVCVCVG